MFPSLHSGSRNGPVVKLFNNFTVLHLMKHFQVSKPCQDVQDEIETQSRYQLFLIFKNICN